MARSKKEIAFQRKVDELVKRANRLEDAEVKKVIQILADARKEVAATIASTEWQAYRLPQFQAAIERAMQEFGDKYGVELRDAQRSFWETGIEMVDLPLRQVGIMAAFPAIDTTALAILQGYGADLVKGLARDAALKINNEILMGLMGQKTPFEVMQAVGRNLKDKSIFTTIAARAETITRTEAGRVLEMASQARLEAAAGLVSGLQKQWLHGEFVRQPRISHLAAAGQIRDVGKPFDVGGEKLMFPRDPAGSAKNTINCHCYTIPYHPDWDRAAPAEGGPEEGRPRERKGERIAVQSVAEAQGEMAEFRKTLTYADERIVSDYTGEKHLQWNRELRRGRLSPENAGPVERLSEILRNAPKLEGEVFRGIGFDTPAEMERFLSQFRKNDIVALPAFTSATTSPEIVEGAFLTRRVNVRMRIVSKNGVWLNGLSDLPQENEVLFDRGSTFLIEKIVKGDIPEIILKEI